MVADLALKITYLRIFPKVLMLILMVNLGACASIADPNANNSTIDEVRNSKGYVTSFEQVDTRDIAQSLNVNTFKVGDVADVLVYNVDELSNTYVVDGSGNISFPLIGKLKVADLTTTQLQQELTQLYGSQYLREPGINVKLETKDLGRIVVDGSVNSPGVFDIKDVVRLTEAIALAAGINVTETDGRIVYISRIIDGERKVTEVDLRSVRKFAATDPQIIPNDVIFVQDNAARRLYREFLKTVPLLNTAVIFATRS